MVRRLWLRSRQHREGEETPQETPQGPRLVSLFLASSRVCKWRRAVTAGNSVTWLSARNSSLHPCSSVRCNHSFRVKLIRLIVRTKLS